MKICPKCRKTYTDDNLNFCLEDGTALASTTDPPPTVMMQQPHVTSPGSLGRAEPTIQSSFGNQPQYAVQPKRSSRAWLWIVGVLAILVLLCGGGGIAGLIWIGMQTNDTDTNSAKKTTNQPAASNSTRRTSNSSPSATPVTSTTDEPPGENEVIDLSLWVKQFSPYGTTEMVGDEFVMASKQKNYYYALVSSEDYSTDGAVTSVAVRNLDGRPSDLGYGLIFNSAPTPLTKDYAFLIDTVKRRYRIVRHEPSKELTIIPWTSSDTINGSTAENIIEVRDKGDTIEFYINGQMVKSVKDQYGFPNGVPGLYAGDAVRAGFKKLEIRK